jgi:hypothetical protein
MFRLVLVIMTAWSCAFAQALPAATAKCQCKVACCAHCASNACHGCTCAAQSTSPQWIGSSAHQNAAARSIITGKVVDRNRIAWSSAPASQRLARGNSYCSRRLASAAENPLFQEHCSLLI